MSGVVDLVAEAMILLGASLALLAALGLHRFTDVLGRMHAASKPATLGLILVAGGTAVLVDDQAGTAKLALVVALQLLTAPVAAHLVGRAAHRQRELLDPATVLAELPDDELR